jgi:hypothetical protein
MRSATQGVASKAPLNRGRQLWHVLWRDLRAVRAPLLVYAGLVVLVAWPGFPDPGRPEGWIPSLLVLPVAVFVTFLFVRNDPPTHADAFWAAYPLAPSAVFGAKLVLVFGLVLGLALAGQGVALTGYRLPWGDLLRLLWSSGLVAASWLLVGMLVATVFRSPASAALAVVIGLVALPLTRILVTLPSADGPFRVAIGGGASAAALLLVGRLYIVPDGMRRGLVTALALGLTVLLATGGAWITRPSFEREVAFGPTRAHPALEGARVEIERIRRSGFSSDGLTVSLELRVHGDAGAHRFRPSLETVTLVDPDGRTEGVKPQLLREGRQAPPADAADRWLGGDPAGRERFEASVTVSPAQWERLSSGSATLHIVTRLEILEVRGGPSIPLRPGAGGASGGTRFRVEEVMPGLDAIGVDAIAAATAYLALQTTTVSAGRYRVFQTHPHGSDLAYALVSADGREGLALSPGSGSRSGGMAPGAAGLVLPGAATSRARFQLLPAGSPHAGPDLDPEWIESARFRVFEWLPVGSVRVSHTESVHGTPGRAG